MRIKKNWLDVVEEDNLRIDMMDTITTSYRVMKCLTDSDGFMCNNSLVTNKKKIVNIIEGFIAHCDNINNGSVMSNKATKNEFILKIMPQMIKFASNLYINFFVYGEIEKYMFSSPLTNSLKSIDPNFKIKHLPDGFSGYIRFREPIKIDTMDSKLSGLLLTSIKFGPSYDRTLKVIDDGPNEIDTNKEGMALNITSIFEDGEFSNISHTFNDNGKSVSENLKEFLPN